MAQLRKYKVFEVTTQDYGKGYIIAGNEKSALQKAMKNSPETFRTNMTSYYFRGTKKQIAKKFRGIRIN
jgi:hypothetical protein